MAIASVTDFSSFINQQIKAQERVEASLVRLGALMAVTVLSDNFYNLSECTLHNYFSIADDLIEEAIKSNQASLSELLRLQR